MIIAVDFDGTIVEHDYPRIGTLIKDAKEVINKLHTDGHTILIWTVRSGIALAEAINYLKENNIHFDRVNCDAIEIAQNPEWINFSPKIYADVYIDDRNVFGLPPWKDIYLRLSKNSAEHKNKDYLYCKKWAVNCPYAIEYSPHCVGSEAQCHKWLTNGCK